MRFAVERYIQGCHICISNKAQRYKLYGNLQTILILTYKWKNPSIDHATGRHKSKNWQEVEYDSILVIFNRLTKMVYYKLILIITNAEQLAKISIEIVIKYQGLLNAIVTNRGSLFTSKFSFFLCHYFNVKRQLRLFSTQRQTGKPKDKTAI